MVVRHLEKYMFENGLTFESNLKTIILEKLSSSSQKDATVIIDFSSFPKLFRENDVSLFCYGQPKIIKDKLQKLTTSITSLGVNLVVVFRGNAPKKLKHWEFRQVQLKNQEDRFLQKLEEGEIIPDILSENLIMYINDCFINTLKSNDCVKMFTSLKNTHEEVAEYARKSKCLAVIGQDSNYNIYNEIPVYISFKSLDIDTLDCVVFDKVKLLQHLKLTSNQLPLFATLVGNDIIDPPRYNKFSVVANFIKDHVDPYQYVSAKIRQIQTKFISSDVNEELLKKSLDVYLKKDGKAQEKLDFLEDKKKSCDINPLLYDLIKTKKIRIPRGLENSKDIQTIPNWKLFLTLRQKIYGVVFNDVIPVEEYIVDLNYNTNAFIYTNTSVFDEEPHPGMEKLWTDSSGTMNQIKWKLFCKTVSQKMTPDILKRVHPNFRIFIASLHYLAYEIPKTTDYKVFNEKYEVMAFVITAVIMNLNLNTEGYTVNVPDCRALLLTSKLYECYNLIMMLNQSCGLIATNEESCWCHFFDGVVFQSIYKKLKKGGNERKLLEDSFLKKIEPFLNVIYCNF